MQRLLLVATISLGCAGPAFAQSKEPIPPYVFDLRGGLTLLKNDGVTAGDLGVTAADLPGHTFGLFTGVQLYPLRRGGFAFGIGGELFVARASDQQTDENTGEAIGPEVKRRFRSLSGQLSLNFGHRTGWSYITAGIGPVAFDTYLVALGSTQAPEPDGLRSLTQNFGFGARWFNNQHVAFELDLRFYLTVPANPTAIVGGRERTTVVVMSAGVGLK
jgi:hypothetical protein